MVSFLVVLQDGGNLKALKTYFLNHLLTMSDGVLHKLSIFCQSLNSFVHFKRDFCSGVYVLLFPAGLKWAGLSWYNVMSHTSVHQSDFSNI